MTVVQHELTRIRAYIEPNGSFATDNSGSMGSFTDVPFVEEAGATWTPGLEILTVGHAQQHIDGMAKKVVGIRTWQLDFTVNLETFATRAGDGTAASQGALGLLIKAAMGGENLGTGDTVNDVSATSESFDVTTASRWAAGGALGAATGAGSALEARPIQGVSGSTVTLKWKLSGAPANSSVLYNAATYYMETGDGDQVQSLQFAVEGYESDDRWLLRGGQLASMSFELGPAVVPKVRLSIKGVAWDKADGSETSGDLTGSLGLASYSDAQTLVTKDSEMRFGTVGTATLTGTLIEAPSYTFEPNIVYVPRKTPAGTETVAGWIRQHTPPVISGTIQQPFQDDSVWRDARDNATDHFVWHQIGSSTSTGCAVLDAPTVQVVDWKRINGGGIALEEMRWEARLDEDVGAETGDMAVSAFRIHLL